VKREKEVIGQVATRWRADYLRNAKIIKLRFGNRKNARLRFLHFNFYLAGSMPLDLRG